MANSPTVHDETPGRRGARRRPILTNMPGRRLLAIVTGLIAVVFLSVVPVSAESPVTPAPAPALPRPFPFVSYLDLECFKTNPYQPPTTTLTLSHINPQLVSLPAHQVTLGNREQLCVPVIKDGWSPPPEVIDFIRYVDLSCYRVTGTPLNRRIVLSQLNPVFAGHPRFQTVIGAPEQLCVPVAKDHAFPPTPEIKELVSHIDLECYAVSPPDSLARPVVLHQLNPVLVNRIPRAQVQINRSPQLCLPVHKRGDVIPQRVLDIVQWIDLLKYDILAPAINPVPLTLSHLNPVLSHLPAESTVLLEAQQLAVPVAKNGVAPPG
ncbi:hypothetical protein [Rhizohabitans arisaemae]|uniref:hypothetical protein n=1 Tax=Rhizohabitans arisaemae TaxID=2720610 RepID=UPI0024B1DB69|nr:hypothetical protein [Rhizohabitans arisaemae]